MFSVRGPKFKYFLLVMALIAFAAGVYITFFQSAGYVKTQATIVSIEVDEEWSDSEDTSYIVMVDYVAEGSRYTSRLDSYSDGWKVGKTVTVYYDPQNPSVIHGGKGGGVYLMVLSVVFIAGILIVSRKNREGLAELEQQRAKGGAAFAPSVKGAEREVYFLTDMGTPKYGHRIEDSDRKVLYEAKMTKFSPFAAHHFDFIDHEHGTTTPHLVSGTEETDWGNSFLLDNHYTFELDGEDVWKHLKRNGVSVETERREGSVWPRFRVSRDGEEIAILEATSQYVHEEDEEQHKVMKKLAVQGFYRIWTREENLDVVFITAMAFGRSGALNDEGGGIGKMVRQSMLGR